jgi:hypothetical protein
MPQRKKPPMPTNQTKPEARNRIEAKARAKSSLRFNLLVSLAALAIGLLACELVVRAMGEFTEDGQFIFRGRVVRPFKMPIKSVQSALDAYRRSDRSLVIYNSVLGWAPRPNHISDNGLYSYNSLGIRSEPREFAPEPFEGVLRIALFGNSYTHGDDVVYTETFGAQLDSALNAVGIPAEVLNFGVGGYGIDQAYLRYHQQGMQSAPQLVVLGFQAENLKRNLNLIRPLYLMQTGLPFAKPRFVLRGNVLDLVDVPVLPPDQIVPTLRRFDQWPLARYEFFYDRQSFARPLWRRSKLLALVGDLARRGEDDWHVRRVIHRPGSAEEKLGWAIINAFADEAKANGAAFMIVHLPTRTDLEVLAAIGAVPCQGLLDALSERFAVVRPEERMLEVGAGSGFHNLFAGHYNALGNRIVAEAMQARIQRDLTDPR